MSILVNQAVTSPDGTFRRVDPQDHADQVQRDGGSRRVRDVGLTVAEVEVGESVGSHPDAFDSWATDITPRLLRLAQLVGHDSHAAADAVQDALVAVLVRWRRLSEPGAADAYARRVVVNHRISWWRRIGRRESPGDDSALDLGTAPVVDVTDAVLARRLVTALPDQQRKAVVLRFFEDLTFAEIADILDCPTSTARSHVHRALARLRAELEEES